MITSIHREHSYSSDPELHEIQQVLRTTNIATDVEVEDSGCQVIILRYGHGPFASLQANITVRISKRKQFERPDFEDKPERLSTHLMPLLSPGL